MNIKYLYGKKKYLAGLISGASGIRITDLSHYARMENEKMRDDEMKRDFSISKSSIEIYVNERKLDSNSFLKDPIISLGVQHCYCLCLSNKKDDELLYKTFEADVCIAFDVDKLLETFEFVFSHKLKGMQIVGKNVYYYQSNKMPENLDPRELAFYKRIDFLHEDEFRIAFFYPLKKKGFKAETGEIIPFYLKNESLFIDISHKEAPIFKECIVDVFQVKS